MVFGRSLPSSQGTWCPVRCQVCHERPSSSGAAGEREEETTEVIQGEAEEDGGTAWRDGEEDPLPLAERPQLFFTDGHGTKHYATQRGVISITSPFQQQ